MTKPTSEYLKELVSQLDREKQNKEITLKFVKQEDWAARIRYSLELLHKMNLLPPEFDIFQPKDDDASLAARIEGNKFFKDADYVSALDCYNRSICLATDNSENLAFGYANRSAVYMNSGFYKFCLENIEMALKNNYPENLRPKFEQRKKECSELMTNREDSLEKFDKAKLPQVQLSYPANEQIPIMIDGLELARSEQFGRYIRTKRDLYPGDVIISEKPFIKFLSSEATYSYCANCLESNYLNLFPCHQCTRAMFCSEDCRQEAWTRFHRYECKIIDEISLFKIPTLRMGIRIALYAFTMFDEPKELENLIKEIDVETESAFTLDYSRLTEQNYFRAIYAFTTNKSSQIVLDFYEYSKICAILWHFLRNHTDLHLMLKTKDMEDFFLNTLFHFIQVAIINAHPVGTNLQSPFGCGFFALSSLLNHSCAPNVGRIMSVDGVTNIVVKRVIKAGEQLFDCYLKPYSKLDKVERQESLKFQYLFDCQCEACIHDYPLLQKLPTTFQLYLQFISDQKRIMSYDKDFATKKFEECKKYLKEYSNKYPNYEFYTSQTNLMLCFCVLMLNLPLNSQLKPLDG